MITLDVQLSTDAYLSQQFVKIALGKCIAGLTKVTTAIRFSEVAVLAPTKILCTIFGR